LVHLLVAHVAKTPGENEPPSIYSGKLCETTLTDEDFYAHLDVSAFGEEVTCVKKSSAMG